MTVLIVYGDAKGEARPPALRLGRALRSLGVDAQVRDASRITRLGRPAAVVVAVDALGKSELDEMIDSFDLLGTPTPVYGMRFDATLLPPGVRTLDGTRLSHASRLDRNGLLRVADRLARRLHHETAPPLA